MIDLAESLELETLRADGLERALRAIAPRLGLHALLSAAEALRACEAGSAAEREVVDYAADLLDEAASKAALGPIFGLRAV